MTLQSETLAKFEQGISFEKLPKTIQQAVEVTYALGQRYLWIDCLCIIQNSESDCALQSRQMCSIYEHAVCTIAAESARNIDQGLFKKQNPLTYMPCEILSDGLTSMVAKPHLVDPQSNERFSNLGKRGWCFQEQLYSHRMLVFGDFGLTWMCEQGQADEWKPEGEGIKPGAGEGVVNSNTKFEVRTIFGPKAQILDCEADLDRPGGLYEGRKEFLSFSKHQLGGATLSPQEAHRRWFGIVAPYSKTTLTYGSDKLVALAGLAARIQANTGFHYLAGIWQGCLPFDLLWTLTFSSTTKRPASYRAPTWSWASIDKEVESWVYWGYDVPAEAILCLLEGCDIQHSDSADVHNIGAVLSASLTLCGMLRYLRAELLSPSVDHEDNSWFTSSKNIHDSGGTFLGQFHPDTPSPDLSTVYLLPVMKSCRDPGFRSTRQLFPWMEDASSRKSDLRNSIMGLALTRLSTEGHHYERLGVFHFDYDSPEDLAATWFDDMEEQKIVIW